MWHRLAYCRLVTSNDKCKYDNTFITVVTPLSYLHFQGLAGFCIITNKCPCISSSVHIRNKNFVSLLAPIKDLSGTRYPSIQPPCLTCFVWPRGSFDHGQNKHVSIMFRTMHCIMWTLYLVKHVLFVIRVNMFRPSVSIFLHKLLY